MSIENTSTPASREVTALLALATGEVGSIIESEERAGQAQLVNSTQLPTRLQSPREDFEAVGFTFGAPTSGDPMFMEGTLPQGWKREASDHAMWSHIVDEHGRRRASIFYKAAFYDRSAHMSLTNVFGYLHHCMYYGHPVVTDDTWATREAIAEAADQHAKQAQADLDTWTRSGNAKYMAEHAAELAKYKAIADEYTD